jgi:flagellar motor switch protein FliN/FliY
MSIQTYKNSYENKINEILPVVKETLGQILQREANLKFNGLNETQTDSALEPSDEGFVGIAFNAGKPDTFKSFVIMPKALALQLYAWMIGDEPAEDFSGEHADGLREAFDQVGGQLNMTIDDSESLFNFSDIQIENYANHDEIIALLDASELLKGEYTLSAEEKNFDIYHLWLGDFDKPAAVVADEKTVEEEQNPIEVSSAEFGALTANNVQQENPQNIDLLLDVDLEVTVELDKKIVMVSELLKFGKGSIIELEKSAGEPLDIFVNGRKFAEGEVVVIDDKFGIRITQLISPKERLQSLA